MFLQSQQPGAGSAEEEGEGQSEDKGRCATVIMVDFFKNSGLRLDFLVSLNQFKAHNIVPSQQSEPGVAEAESEGVAEAESEGEGKGHSER